MILGSRARPRRGALILRAWRRRGAPPLAHAARHLHPLSLLPLEVPLLRFRLAPRGDAVRALRTARRAGFDNVSLDLIHGGEGESVAQAARDAAIAAELGPEHVSCYALTLTGLAEEVPMAKAVRRGELSLPGDEE